MLHLKNYRSGKALGGLLALTLSLSVLACSPLSAQQQFERGDADGSSNIDITDGIFILQYLFLGGRSPTCLKAADVEDSGAVDITDGIYVLNFLFLGGAAPPPPHGACGLDPTPDDLSCATFKRCRGDQPPAIVPDVTIVSPVNLLVVGEPTVLVQGEVAHENFTPGELIVSVNGIAAVVDADTGEFSAEINLIEGANNVTAVAEDPDGNAGSVNVSVVLDTTAPTVVVDSPSFKGAICDPLQSNAADLVTFESSTTITGVYNDIGSAQVGTLVGSVTIRSTDCEGNILEEERASELDGKSFVFFDFPLSTGLNRIEVFGEDGVGNRSAAVVRTISVDQTFGQTLRRISGDGQSAPINAQIADPLVVEVRDGNGRPVENALVRFTVVRNDGQVGATAEEEPTQNLFVRSDANGQARAFMTLGSRVGAGFNRVSATAAGFAGEALFCATTFADIPQKILAAEGREQTGSPGEPLPLPLVALAVDREGNPIANLTILFEVIEGGGTLASGGTNKKDVGSSRFEALTNSEGLAAAVFTLGEQEGIQNHRVIARFEGLEGAAAVFTESAKAPGAVENTAVVGVVLDNSDLPMNNVTLQILDSQRQPLDLETRSNEEGFFRIEGVPVGSIILKMIGNTTDRPGLWPNIEFRMTTIAGQDNQLPDKIRVPQIDEGSTKLAGGDTLEFIEMKALPGMGILVEPNSTFVEDAQGNLIQLPIEVSISQVKLDKIPMPPPNGSVFMPPAWTIQPPGVIFDPPAKVHIPNDGMQPGRVIDVFQFDHDIERFTNVGTATTLPDGSMIISDDGFGVTKSGWGGCGQPPPPVNCPSSCPPCQKCVNGSCAPDPAKDGQSCDGTDCGVCQGGSCGPNPNSEGMMCDTDDWCIEDGSEECDDGLCKGDKKPLPGNCPPSINPIEIDLTDNEPVRNAVTILKKFKALKTDKAPNAKFKYGCVFEEKCCSEKMKFVCDKKCSIEVSLELLGLEIDFPVAAMPGITVVGGIGLEFSVSADITKNECTMCLEGGGSGTLKIPLKLGVSFGRPLVDVGIATFTGGVSGGVSIRGDCNGTKLCIGAQIDDIKLEIGCVDVFGRRCLYRGTVVEKTPLGEKCTGLSLP